MPSNKSPRCLIQVNQGTWCQEEYETSSREARTRASQLRKAGYSVTVSSLGRCVTDMGLLRLSMLDILPGTHPDTFNLPAVEIARVGLSSQQSR